MELDLVPSGVEEEGGFEVNQNYNNDTTDFEVETCGICMDGIVDRGVLDCCQHWFCFACIDNWATITNLCPLCQNEFQSITCVPVYDTVGSSKVDEDSSSRVDDWSIEGQNNSLSFPSYYIDENAVVCLDGHGCKIRSGAVTIEGDSSLDTSIACDSCDLWYHAFCVGFDTEGTCESTWLCPRCAVDEAPKKSNADSINSVYAPENANGQSLVEVNSSQNVFVSVADSGETALVVSIVGENKGNGDPTVSVLPTLEVGKGLESQTLPSASVNSHKVEKPSEQRNINQPAFGAQELALTLSCDTSSLQLNSLAQKQSRMSFSGSTSEFEIDDMRNTSGKSFNESDVSGKQSDNDSTMGLHLGLSVGSFLSAADMNTNGTEDQKIEDVKQHDPSEFFFSKADMLVPKHEPEDWKQHNPIEEDLRKAEKIVPDASNAPGTAGGEKRKRTDCSDDINVIADNGDPNAKIETKVSVKKIGDEEKIQPIASASSDQAKAFVPDGSKRCSSQIACPKDRRLTFHPVEDNTSSDKIVRTAIPKSSKGLKRPNPADKSLQEETMAGLRVKKIMRRAAEDKESSVVVQTLRKEIREAVSNKSSKDVGKNLFDPKLLDAFRAAVAGPKTQPVKKLSHLELKAKKAVFQKGNIRENLTKKIYASSNGRRKRAWDRDCEVEFWKHRCIGTTEPEKIKTLKSVLDLLKGRSEGADTEQESDRQPTNPILSRVYLADTSLLPRKEDIKPLLALKTFGSSEQDDKQLTSREKCTKSSLNGSTSNSTESKVSLKVRAPSLENHGGKSSAPSSENNTGSTKVRQDRHLEGSLVSSSGGSKSITNELVDKTVDVKSDKRKWALQILARKMNAAGGNATNEKQEDKAVLKGNYPLIAQLPVDMRPVLAPSRHNKIPFSVRQTQLYRLTEHLLRKANLVVIHRNADTELAVADAINIEKEVADRSKSKLVYLNLCSQKLLHRPENSNSSGIPVISSPPSSVPTDRSEQAANDVSTDPVIEAALRNAGLLSDSPPNSPQSNMEVPAEEEGPSRDIKEEGPDNVFDMDCNPDLDIYGDFEYSLEDEDYIGATATKVPNPQPEEGAPKLKLVFSTAQPESSNHTLDLEKTEKTVEARKDSCDMLENHTDSGVENFTMEGGTDKFCVPLESLFGKEGEELSVAECEELYGPDKEPLIQEFPGVSGLIDEALIEDKHPTENGNYVPKPNQAIETSESANENNGQNKPVAGVDCTTGAKDSTNHPQPGGNAESKEKKSSGDSINQSKSNNSISKKVEAYIKEHLRPLCKSGVITVEQYKWAVTKTTDKVMKYHSHAKNASFLIKEGEKVKKLAEQYVETAQQKDDSDSL